MTLLTVNAVSDNYLLGTLFGAKGQTGTALAEFNGKIITESDVEREIRVNSPTDPSKNRSSIGRVRD